MMYPHRNPEPACGSGKLVYVLQEFVGAILVIVNSPCWHDVVLVLCLSFAWFAGPTELTVVIVCAHVGGGLLLGSGRVSLVGLFRCLPGNRKISCVNNHPLSMICPPCASRSRNSGAGVLES